MKKLSKKLLSVLLVIAMLIPTGSLMVNTSAEDTSYNVGDIIEFGSYPKDEITDSTYVGKTTTFNGKTYSVEPIEWRILKVENGKALLIAEEIIDNRPYNSTSETVDGYHGNNYAHSDIRKWLINEFYNTAFSSAEKNFIVATTLDNSAAPTDFNASGSYTEYSSESTTDKVFLLSKDEANTYASKYFGTTGTDYAYANGMTLGAGAGSGKGVYWLLRTAGNNTFQIYYVHMRWGKYVTYFNWSGEGVLWPMGVRPAIYLDLDKWDSEGDVLGESFASKYGWCIPNYWEALGYEEGKYRISPERYSEVYGISMSSLIYSGLQYVGNDAGRCFGLSLLAACNYLGKIDLSSYFASGGDCLYEYGYSSIETYEEHGTQFYSIKGNDAALHLIERAHIVQKSVEIKDYEIYKDSDFSELINHFSQENATPILMNMEGYGHTVLLTSDKFETNGNTVLISMWDPNLPYDNVSLQTPMFCYENDVDKLAYFKFDRVTLKWEYWKQGKICASGEKNSFLSGVSFYDVSQIPATFFSDTLNMWYKHAQIDLYGSDITIENENGDTLLKIENNKIVNIAENCDYECTYNNGSENTIQTGTFYTDDTSKLTILSDDAEFLAMSQDYYFSSSITESAEIVCDFSAGTITANNLEQTGCQIDIRAQNVDKNYAVSTTTDLNYNDSISLYIGDSKAEVKTNKNENDIILENDGIELIDVDVVHEHTEKSIPETSANCTEAGLTKGLYCSVCEIVITEQSIIPATGHSDANHDGICDACSEDFTKGCSCNCHGNAFMQFLHKIITFLRRLFGMTQYQYCGCGKAHW